MLQPDALLTLDPEEDTIRVSALHAYCPRLFFLEEVEGLRVADEAVFAGRRLHVELERTELCITHIFIGADSLDCRVHELPHLR